MTEQAFVTSDLHIGSGDVDPRLEDFFQDTEFARFVDSIAAPDTTLFINGDFIDFAQIPPYETAKPNHLLWHEDASLEKLELALKARCSTTRPPRWRRTSGSGSPRTPGAARDGSPPHDRRRRGARSGSVINHTSNFGEKGSARPPEKRH